MLTDECKEVLYPNVNVFSQNYYEEKFDTKKTCGIKLWSEKTYRIELRENLMSTGEYKESYIQDFYTIKSGKLNINGYVKRQRVNKFEQKDSIEVFIKSIDYFIDYTKVNYKVSNKTDKNIILSKAENEKDIVLVDKNKNEHMSNSTEFQQEDFVVNKNTIKEFNLTFDVSYTKSLEFRRTIFYNIIRNYTGDDRKDILKIEVSL